MTHQLMLHGLKSVIIETDDKLGWAGFHPPSDSIQHEIDRRKPRVIVMDSLALKSLPKFPLLWKNQKIGTVILAKTNNLEEVSAALQQGVLGIVHETEPIGTVLGAIVSAANQRIWIPAHLRDRLLSRNLHDHDGSSMHARMPLLSLLSPKEKLLVGLVVEHPEAKSLTLASWMGVKESTIRNRLSRIYSKLHLHGRAALVKFAHQQEYGGSAL